MAIIQYPKKQGQPEDPNQLTAPSGDVPNSGGGVNYSGRASTQGPGTGFINLQDYLGANDASQFGQQTYDKAYGQANDFKNNLTQFNNGYNDMLHQSANPGIQGYGTNGDMAFWDPQSVKDTANWSYQGPMDLTGYGGQERNGAAYGALQDQGQKAADVVSGLTQSGLGQTGGYEAALSSIYSPNANYSQGAKSMDAALLGSSGQNFGNLDQFGNISNALSASNIAAGANTAAMVKAGNAAKEDAQTLLNNDYNTPIPDPLVPGQYDPSNPPGPGSYNPPKTYTNPTAYNPPSYDDSGDSDAVNEHARNNRRPIPGKTVTQAPEDLGPTIATNYFQGEPTEKQFNTFNKNDWTDLRDAVRAGKSNPYAPKAKSYSYGAIY